MHMGREWYLCLQSETHQEIGYCYHPDRGPLETIVCECSQEGMAHSLLLLFTHSPSFSLIRVLECRREPHNLQIESARVPELKLKCVKTVHKCHSLLQNIKLRF